MTKGAFPRRQLAGYGMQDLLAPLRPLNILLVRISFSVANLFRPHESGRILSPRVCVELTKQIRQVLIVLSNGGLIVDGPSMAATPGPRQTIGQDPETKDIC